MPRRIDPKMCGCGCLGMTRGGEFLRGHHTKVRWELVKAIADGTERRLTTRMHRGTVVTAETAGGELARRGWLLPDCYRHFGVELEVIGRSSIQIQAALNAARIPFGTGGYHAVGSVGDWMITSDASVRANPAQMRRGLSHGAEVVSPPLRGKKGLAMVRRVMTAFADAGIEVNKSCGGHVHHEARDFSLDAMKRLVRSYESLQRAIDRVLPASRRSTTRNHYCERWGDYELIRLDSATTLQQAAQASTKYRTLNVMTYASYGTVEFRQHQGTVEADKLINWILFGQALVKAAVKGVAIMMTDSLAEAAIELGCSESTGRYFEARARALRVA